MAAKKIAKLTVQGEVYDMQDLVLTEQVKLLESKIIQLENRLSELENSGGGGSPDTPDTPDTPIDPIPEELKLVYYGNAQRGAPLEIIQLLTAQASAKDLSLINVAAAEENEYFFYMVPTSFGANREFTFEGGVGPGGMQQSAQVFELPSDADKTTYENYYVYVSANVLQSALTLTITTT